MNKVLFGDCRDTMRGLIAQGVRVQMCVTSPPYFGLRSYLPDDSADKTAEIGLESTPEEFVANMVEVFGLVRELLADDGVLFLNIGDSYSAGVANVADFVKRELERGIIFFGSADPRGCSAERINVLVYDKLSPNLIFDPLFTTQRISIKNGQHDLCEIGGSFNSPVECFGSCAFRLTRPDDANTEFVVNLPEHIGIIVTAGDLRTNAALRSTIALAVKDRKAPLPIEISAEPVSEGVSSSVPAFDTVTFNAGTKSGSEVDVVNDAVTLLDRSNLSASNRGDFAVRESSGQKLSLSLHGGTNVCFVGIGHLFLLGNGLSPYATILEKAQQSFNENRPKQELGIPEMVKRALMRDGWICRQTIIWAKPNPMPESVTDRCTKAHEYMFLLSKRERYYFDARAIAQPIAESSKERLSQPNLENQQGSDRVPGKTNGNMKAVGPRFGGNKYGDDGREESRTKSGNEYTGGDGLANRRSVWTVPTQPYGGAHFATFPPALIEPCILAGSRPGDIVLDPFFGSGTTGQVAQALGRQWIGCELNPDYAPLQEARTAQQGMAL